MTNVAFKDKKFRIGLAPDSIKTGDLSLIFFRLEKNSAFLEWSNIILRYWTNYVILFDFS